MNFFNVSYDVISEKTEEIKMNASSQNFPVILKSASSVVQKTCKTNATQSLNTSIVRHDTFEA